MKPDDLIKALGTIDERYVSEMLEQTVHPPLSAEHPHTKRLHAKFDAKPEAEESFKAGRILPELVALGCAAACVTVMAGIALFSRIHDEQMRVLQSDTLPDYTAEITMSDASTSSDDDTIARYAVTTAPPQNTYEAADGSVPVFSYSEVWIPIPTQTDPIETVQEETPVMTVPLTTQSIAVATEPLKTSADDPPVVLPNAEAACEYGDVDMDGMVTFVDGMLVWYDEYCRTQYADDSILTETQRALISPVTDETADAVDQARTITMLAVLRLWFGYPELTLEELLTDYNYYDRIIAAQNGQQLPADAADYYAVYLRLNDALAGLQAGTISDADFCAEMEAAREQCHLLAETEP